MSHSKVMTHYNSIQMLKQGVMCKPRFADLHLSNACNQHCLGCAYGGFLDMKIMERADCYKVIGELLNFGVKGFDFAGGGEPLCLTYISDMFNFVKENAADYGLITNGTLLTDKLIEQLVTQATYVRISLEATDRDLYMKYKRVPEQHWGTALKNISKLVSYRDDMKSNTEIGIKFSVSKSLGGEKFYQRGYDLGYALGVDNVQFKALRHEPEELTYDMKAMEYSRCDSIRHKTGGPQVRSWIIPRADIPQCWLNPLHAVVDYTGNMYLCCYYYYRNDKHKIGNLLKQSMRKVWYSDRHKELIKGIDKKECALVDCKFFEHHKVVAQQMEDGRCNFL